LITPSKAGRADVGLPHVTLIPGGEVPFLASALTANQYLYRVRIQVEIIQSLISVLLPLSSNMNVNTAMNEAYAYDVFSNLLIQFSLLFYIFSFSFSFFLFYSSPYVTTATAVFTTTRKGEGVGAERATGC
jgi:hypothetical protein